MTRTNSRLHALPLSLVAAAAIGLGGCSKHDPDLATPAAASMPAPVAVAPVPVAAPAPVAAAPAPDPRVVVAQNDRAYDPGRRDLARHDRQRDARELPPRADRDADIQRHDPRVAAAVCHECGVVEAVSPVKVPGQTSGVGAVAGGVGGALVGNRIAGGNHRTLGGVVGAVGGGLLGNAIEKHQRTTTVYDVSVRMEDGSVRTVRESTAPVVGGKVRLDADGLHPRG